MSLIITILLSSQLRSQTHHPLENKVSEGPDRVVSLLHNTNLAPGAFSLTHHNYTAIPDWGGYLSIWSGSSTSAIGNGINLVAQEGDAKIRFYTLGAQPHHLRMTLLGNGNFGIGTPNPRRNYKLLTEISIYQMLIPE